MVCWRALYCWVGRYSDILHKERYEGEMSDSTKDARVTEARKPVAMTRVVPLTPEERGRQPVAMTPVQPPSPTPSSTPESQPAGATQTTTPVQPPAQNAKK